MSDTNRVGIRFARNNDTAIPITLANDLNYLRFTGSPSLGINPRSVSSNQINSDRNPGDLILVGKDSGGDCNIELSSQSFDELISGAMFSSWTNAPRKTGATEIASFGAGTVTLDSATDFQTGMVVRLENVGGIDVGQGVYTITVAGAVLTCTPWDATTNALTGSATASAITTCKATGFKATANGEITLNVTGSVATLSASGGSTLGDYMGSGSELSAGQWIKLHGFATAANNVWARVVTADGTNITFNAPTGAATDAAASEQVTIFYGDHISNGAEAVSSHTFAVERRYEDHSPVSRELFLQMAIAGFQLQLESEEIATGSITFTGATAEADTTVGNLYSGGAPTDLAEISTAVYNTSSNVGRLGRDDDVIGASSNYVLSADIQISNDIGRKRGLGFIGGVGLRVGEFSVTGTLTTHFDDLAILQALLAQTETTFDIALIDGDGRATVLDLPRIKYGTGSPQVPGKNADVTFPAGFQALKHATLGYTMSNQRMAFAA